MGIKGFSKVFAPQVIKQSNLKGLSGAIDASVILYQSCLGMSSVSGLTDSNGSPTLHINVIIARVLNFIKGNIGQVWVLDYHEHGYTSPDKEIELVKRRERKIAARKKLDELEKKREELKTGRKCKQRYCDLFTDSDEDDYIPETPEGDDEKELETKINQQEKITFSVDSKIVNDCKFILDCFDICWCVAPKGIEAEQVCAEFTTSDELNFLCDFVYSTDIDSLLYGATQLVRSTKANGKKVLQLYDLSRLLDSADITKTQLQKLGVILGCDHAAKTKGIGPKTVLKKLKHITLTTDQRHAIDIFNKPVDVTKIKFNNPYDEVAQASDCIKINKLLDWLVMKNFNRDRIRTQILKAVPTLSI
jgi:hypothetical protein